ncbi:hypothetical protein DFH06DRAFT_375503 [Mycena polygramma]|nr:hypothetical protein DFH06DRAFT_375503 [Mycena polygramma]
MASHRYLPALYFAILLLASWSRRRSRAYRRARHPGGVELHAPRPPRVREPVDEEQVPQRQVAQDDLPPPSHPILDLTAHHLTATTCPTRCVSFSILRTAY